MARIKPIRITENDRKEYARLVKNSKSKIARTKKKYGINLDTSVELPPIEEFSTRSDFNKWKEQTSSFTNRNNLNFQFVKNKYDVVASKKEINELIRDTKKAQTIAKKLTKEAENKPFISGGKEQGTLGQRMKQMARPSVNGITIPPDFDFDKINTKKRLENKKQNMKERANPFFHNERMANMIDRFTEMLSHAFNSDADELIDKIKRIPISDFYELYLLHDEFNFEEYGSGEEFVDIQEKQMNALNQMNLYIDEYLEGKEDLDLKGYPRR